MKKTILFVILVAIFTSCTMETYQCHSYGNTNRNTKHGVKSQARYNTKHRI